MSNFRIHPRVEAIGLPAAFLLKIAESAIKAELAEASARRRRKLRRPGHTLRPGEETPYWNELVRAVRPHLRRRGSKSLLARHLGITRYRLYVCLTARRSLLDGERTLRLILWLASRSPHR